MLMEQVKHLHQNQRQNRNLLKNSHSQNHNKSSSKKKPPSNNILQKDSQRNQNSHFRKISSRSNIQKSTMKNIGKMMEIGKRIIEEKNKTEETKNAVKIANEIARIA